VKWLSRRLLSIRTQMVIVFVVCSLIIASLIAAVSLHVLYSAMEKQAAAALSDVASRINTEMQSLIDEATRLLNWGNVSVVSDFFYGEGVRHRQASAVVAAFQDLRDSRMIGQGVENVYLFDTDGYGYNERTGLFYLKENERTQAIFDAVVGATDTLIYLDGEATGPCLLLGTAVLQIATHNVLGYMAIELRTDAIENVLVDATLGEGGACFIADAHGMPLFGAGDESQRIAEGIFSQSGKTTLSDSYMDEIGPDLVAVSRLTKAGWYIVGYAPMQELMSEFYETLEWLLMVIAAALLLAFTLYIFVSKRMTRPIQRLKNCMLMAADGNLDALAYPLSKNEFSVLEKQYNRMLTDIKALIERNRKEQANVQKAELRALQAQINPHFLYNTLDAIMWMVAANDNAKAIEMLDQLSIFFRIGLSKGLDWISVREDIEHLYSYLYIQRVRYSDLLDFTVDVDEGMMECMMLKLTLQPIVENAIYHGIRHKKEGGKITVTGRMDEEGALVFQISDTGAGMSLEESSTVLNALRGQAESERASGFGLFNVDRRIKLYCGDNYGLTLESQEGIGTTVTVRMRPREDDNTNV